MHDRGRTCQEGQAVLCCKASRRKFKKRGGKSGSEANELPSLHVILPGTIVSGVVGPGAIFAQVKVGSIGVYFSTSLIRTNSLVWTLGTGVVLKVLHVVGSVATLEESVRCRAFLLSLPEKMSAERLRQFSSKHVTTGSSWGVCHRVRSVGVHHNRLRSGDVRATHDQAFLVLILIRRGLGNRWTAGRGQP